MIKANFGELIMCQRQRIDEGLIRHKDVIMEYVKRLNVKIPSVEEIRGKFGKDGVSDELILLRYLMTKVRQYME